MPQCQNDWDGQSNQSRQGLPFTDAQYIQWCKLLELFFSNMAILKERERERERGVRIVGIRLSTNNEAEFSYLHYSNFTPRCWEI